MLGEEVFAVEDRTVWERRSDELATGGVLGTAALVSLAAVRVWRGRVVLVVCADVDVTQPVVQEEVLRHDVALPLVLAGKSRIASGEPENTNKGPGVLLLDVVLKSALVFEGVGALRAGVGALVPTVWGWENLEWLGRRGRPRSFCGRLVNGLLSCASLKLVGPRSGGSDMLPVGVIVVVIFVIFALGGSDVYLFQVVLARSNAGTRICTRRFLNGYDTFRDQDLILNDRGRVFWAGQAVVAGSN